ncbi:MAG: hypothetical protein IPF92_29420 [Myxococcales bacterium]|nr:hypothetical protein [Myxococcales bacterium]MBL0196799.1 hypothetical protein [Myxococcales bacterium]HQY64464.1 hypothetical protein [Polyangiaceae bacterium]
MNESANDPVIERLIALVRRELGADDVRVLDVAAAEPEAPNALVTTLPDGRHLVASFVVVPHDRAALARRLDMLASTFAASLEHLPATGGRAPVSLPDELRALATRSAALDVLVIDARSPVVWASALARESAPRADLSRRQLIDPDTLAADNTDVVFAIERSAARERGAAGLDPSEDTRRLEVGGRAVDRARLLAETAQVNRGHHLRHVESTEEHGLYVVSFLGIYLLVLAFDGPFDELRAERSASEALPVIERLVEVLPPHDPEPEPMGGVGSVISFRRRR